MDIAEKIVRAKTDYNEVYDAGQNKGYNDGFNAGTDYGFAMGKQESYNEGYFIGFEAGKDEGKYQEWNAFWDVFQTSGKRTNYQGAFYGLGWTDENFKPKYDLVPTSETGASSMFFMCRIVNIAKALDEAGVKLDFSKAEKLQSVFQASAYTTALPPIDMKSCTSCNNLVYGLTGLTSLELNNVREDCTFSKAFNSCSALENLTITGTIGQNGFDIHWSTKLTVPSLNNVIARLKDYSQDTSGTTYKLTLGTTNLAKLTDAEKAVATQKGWTLA